MDKLTQYAISGEAVDALTLRGCQQPSSVAEFPDLAPGLVMSTFRSARVWGGMAWRRAFAGRADQSAAARRMVGQLLADTGRADDARWVTAELVSNALRHSFSGRERGFFLVEVLRGAESVRIVVYDLGGGSVPDFSQTPGSVPELAEDGRGLAAVAELADRTGVAGNAATGHAVWAELSLMEGVTGPSSDDVTGDRVEEPSGVLGPPPPARPGSSRQEEGVRLDPSVALRERS
ncbi:ATP-binding protein [Nonomuraea sp. NPDC003560]|uniref:ATP-binding protein n=1 Tax=Nonomuraea sp. NPDC003560 TaxID=3364341 RepID=UPI003692EA19